MSKVGINFCFHFNTSFTAFFFCFFYPNPTIVTWNGFARRLSVKFFGHKKRMNFKCSTTKAKRQEMKKKLLSTFIHSFFLFFPGHCWTVLNSFVNKEKKAPRTSTTNDSKWWPHTHTIVKPWMWMNYGDRNKNHQQNGNKQTRKKNLTVLPFTTNVSFVSNNKTKQKKCIESRNSGRNSEKKIRNKRDDEYPGSSII